MHTDTDHFSGETQLGHRRTDLASKTRFTRANCFLLSECGHAVRSHRNPVPSWHYTNGRTGWRDGC
jgi:hypothetical protein